MIGTKRFSCGESCGESQKNMDKGVRIGYNDELYPVRTFLRKYAEKDAGGAYRILHITFTIPADERK